MSTVVAATRSKLAVFLTLVILATAAFAALYLDSRLDRNSASAAPVAQENELEAEQRPPCPPKSRYGKGQEDGNGNGCRERDRNPQGND